jgi:hypothetical protein
MDTSVLCLFRKYAISERILPIWESEKYANLERGLLGLVSWICEWVFLGVGPWARYLFSSVNPLVFLARCGALGKTLDLWVLDPRCGA